MSFAFTSVDSLIDRIRVYRPKVDAALLRGAYAFGMQAHAAHMRQGGDPYFTHPIAVAEILIGWGLDDATIAAAFLHDTVEDVAEITLRDLAAQFGAEVAELVDGVTKLEELEDARDDKPYDIDFSLDAADPKRRKQAEDLRKLLVAMSRDPRVLLIKLADRLHNARTFDGMPIEKQRRKAKETMDIYAPMAGRMGMQTMREALEDICFKILHPSARRQILRDFVRLRRQHGDAPIDETIAHLKALMCETGLAADVSGRRKMPFSIWSKMQMRRISFDKLSDVVGFRILVDDISACYTTVGAVHQRWPIAPGRFKDYISVPKPNGYRSIHTTVVDDAQRRIEIQIRTHNMHRFAEQGAAAHWSYRDGVGSSDSEQQMRRLYGWLRDMVETSNNGDEDAIDFVERARAEMHVDQIYCLTPGGEVIHLPRGATPLDFAYAVHTQIGECCYSAEVDGRPVQLFTTLRNGQTVKILQSKSARPTLDMLPWVQTQRARVGVKRAVKAREMRDHAAEGRRVVQGAFDAVDLKLTEAVAESAARSLKFKSAEQMFACVWRANLNAASPTSPKGPTAPDVLRQVDPIKAAEFEGARAVTPEKNAVAVQADEEYVSDLLHGATWRYCRGCMPIPGDRIIGLRAPVRRRLTAHRLECPDVARDEDNAEKWVYARWRPGEELRSVHLARLTIQLAHQPCALGRMCQVIGEMGCNIDDLRFITRHLDYYQIEVVLAVRDLKHLFAVQQALNMESVVLEAVRAAPRADDAELDLIEI